jgi:hypothetical protein
MREVIDREFRGGSRGVSVPIAKGVRFRTGSFRGKSVVGGSHMGSYRRRRHDDDARRCRRDAAHPPPHNRPRSLWLRSDRGRSWSDYMHTRHT